MQGLKSEKGVIQAIGAQQMSNHTLHFKFLTVLWVTPPQSRGRRDKRNRKASAKPGGPPGGMFKWGPHLVPCTDKLNMEQSRV